MASCLDACNKGLVIVRAVDVHEPFAQRGENAEGRGRAVDELAVGARGGEDAFENELVVFAWLEAVFFEERPAERAF